MKNELYNLTNPQKSILLTEEFYKGSNINNICGTAIIDDILDFDLLKKAMHIFIKNHDSFNMKLVLDNNEIKQYLDESSNNSTYIEIIDIDSKSDIAKIENDMLNHVFDIYNGDLFCMKIFRLKDNTGGFIVNVHHLFGDSWSLGILANDIVRIYSCLLNGEDVAKNNDFSYLNYINSEKEYLNSDKFKNDKTYWDKVFDTTPELATIPSSISNVNDDFFPKANRKLYNIDNNLMDKINEFCKLNRVSVFNFFMGVYATYIGKVSGVNDFVIGTPILNRTNFNEKHTTGMFINTAPLRFLIYDNLDFKSFVSNIAKDSLGMLRHQKYYYQNILEDLRKKDSSLPNLYNVLLSYQVTKAASEKGLNYSTRWNFNGTSNDDMDIHLFDLNGTGSIDVAYDYRVSKYTDTDIEDMHNRILHMIWQILERKDILLKDIEVVTSKEKYDILYKFNATDMDYPKDKTIVDLFEEQVEKTPDNIAIICEDKKLTYRELNEKANRLANFLISSGINIGDIVGIMINRSLEMIVGLLGILKSGAAYLPIDPDYPLDRITYMLENSGSNCVLVNSNTISLLPNDINKIDISFNSDIYLSNSIDKLNINILSTNLMYLIYTSGSTGNPKGVMLSHKNLHNFILGMTNKINFSSSKTIVSLTTISFDIFGLEIWCSLANGLRVVIATEKEQSNVELFNKLCLKYNVNMVQTTPSRFSAFLTDSNYLDFLNNITDIMVGGEPLSPILLDKLHSLTKAKIYNMYGPTETSVWSTVKDLTNEFTITIGTPICNTRCYILDKNMNLLPPHAIGELYIGGDGLSNGYFKREELTSKVFLPSPFSDDILYNTKDFAYLNKYGELVILGRSDFQVKVRGYRIELGEIENIIAQFDGINSCAVICHIQNDKQLLCAYYTSTCKINVDNLRNYLLSKLPTYMIPSHFIEIDKMPYTPNGKINRKGFFYNFTKEEKEIIIPKDELEKQVYDIIASISNITTFSMDDNLFNIGIDSIELIKLTIQINSIFGISIPIKDLYSFNSILDLVNYIRSNHYNYKISSLAKLPKMDYYPLSSAQKRIYYASSLDSNSTLYNIAGGIIVDKMLDIKLLQECFQALIDRHEVLRTHFDITQNDIVQVVEDRIHFTLLTDTLNSNDLNSVYADFVKPFDLGKAPLFKAKAVSLPNNKMLLLLDMHHIISDGTSLGILLQELCDLYNGNTLPEKHIDYKDFTLWEKEQFEKDEFKNLQNFWVNQFNDEIPLLNMPTTYPRPSVQSFEGSNYYATLPKDVFEKVNEVVKKLGITPYMLMLSAYYILLSKYSSGDDIVVGTPIACRELPELSSMLGMFVNTLALRGKVDSSMNFSDYTSIVKDYCLACFQNQAYPFDKLVKELNIKRDTSRNPLFDVMFIYQNNGYPSIDFKGTNTEYFVPNSNISKFDLSLEVIPMDNEFSLRFEYCTKLFDEDFIKRLSGHYINILNAILENTNIKIADIDMLSEEERNQILYDFNNTKADYPSDKTIVQLFEEQVEKTPDNIAVIFEDKELTYRELNEKSNQLARFLLANNAKAEDKICILLNKSLEMIVSILGILKIGAVFLPIDLNYPKERIDYIISDSNANILLTTQNLISKANDTVKVLNVELDNCQFMQYSKNNPNIAFSSDNLAYVMYTSGSTGKPKGVMVTHKNVIRLVKNNQFIHFEEDERILQTGSIVFDACTFEIWGALLNGFEVFIIKKELLLDTNYLQHYIDTNKITSLFITTQLFNQLVDLNIDIFTNISNVLTGGEAVSVKHMNTLNLYNKNINIIHCYGPTENTTFSTCYDVKKIPYTDTVPIGKPISNSTTYVMSPFNHLCPIGIPGELWVGGDGVSMGYLNNETLTNEKFVKNPFDDGMVYKTGDLVKWLPDGNIEFIGRIDNQVKVRGFRIELSEIDNKILDFPKVKYSTTVLNMINDEKVICSYFVADEDININDLKDFLKKFLPTYMIPTYVLQMESFNMNINGKIDKKSLPTDFNILKPIKQIELPKNEYERKLLTIFNKIINIKDISVTDNLFDDLHGDSLMAMKIQVEALSQNINIAYSDIFKYPSIRSLAAHLESMQQNIDNTNDFSNIDFSIYNEVLKNNSLSNPIEVVNTPINNLLLTGFTGFLGAHVLDSFIKKENGTIYCLIRSKNNVSAEDRLLNVLHFYFEDMYDKLIGNRIRVIEGDISLEHFGLSNKDYVSLGKHIDTIVHSAALVKHYGMYKDFENSNITGTKNVVDFATKFNIKLLHISTLSVSGNNFADGANVDNHFGRDVDFCESDFYIGQNLSGVYAKTKFIAEKIVLDAILSNSLNACILRMGNLTSRFSEGKFQQNHFENAFVNRFKSFLQIGYVPDYMLHLYAEFTPIDYCGDAIIEIAKHFNKKYTVFHLMNEKRVYLDRLFEMMSSLNIDLKVVKEDEFIKVINDLLLDDNKKMYIEGIINDFDKSNKHLVYESEVKVKCDFSKEFLNKIGFTWPYIDINYIRNYFAYLKNIGYLNIDLV